MKHIPLPLILIAFLLVPGCSQAQQYRAKTRDKTLPPRDKKEST
jgi:hypothetical protein